MAAIDYIYHIAMTSQQNMMTVQQHLETTVIWAQEQKVKSDTADYWAGIFKREFMKML